MCKYIQIGIVCVALALSTMGCTKEVVPDSTTTRRMLEEMVGEEATATLMFGEKTIVDIGDELSKALLKLHLATSEEIYGEAQSALTARMTHECAYGFNLLVADDNTRNDWLVSAGTIS